MNLYKIFAFQILVGYYIKFILNRKIFEGTTYMVLHQG